MRTTVEIEEDIWVAAEEIARRQRLETNKVVSLLLREALALRLAHGQLSGAPVKSVGGFRPFAPRGGIITDKFVNALRDAEGV